MCLLSADVERPSAAVNYSSSSPVDTWRQVTEALVSRASDPDFPLDGLTASQRSYLRITKPIAIVQGHAVLATPNQIAKRVCLLYTSDAADE